MHVNQVRVTRVDASGESEEELAQFILKVKDDPSYRISFKGSIVDKVSPTYDGSVLDVVFSDHINSGSRKLPAKSLWVKKIALSNNSSSTNVSNSVNNVLASDGCYDMQKTFRTSTFAFSFLCNSQLLCNFLDWLCNHFGLLTCQFSGYTTKTFYIIRESLSRCCCFVSSKGNLPLK